MLWYIFESQMMSKLWTRAIRRDASAKSGLESGLISTSPLNMIWLKYYNSEGRRYYYFTRFPKNMFWIATYPKRVMCWITWNSAITNMQNVGRTFSKAILMRYEQGINLGSILLIKLLFTPLFINTNRHLWRELVRSLTINYTTYYFTKVKTQKLKFFWKYISAIICIIYKLIARFAMQINWLVSLQHESPPKGFSQQKINSLIKSNKIKT